MPEIIVERRYGATRKAVLKGLSAFNRSKMVTRVEKRIALSLREGDDIVGGIVGECWTEVFFIELFWLAEAYRGRDFGSGLLEGIEAQARSLGARTIYLDSLSFQAPDFYRRHGYTEFGRLAGYPDGITRHWLSKTLTDPAAPLPS